MKILTIIVSYNFIPWIERCMSSLAASTYPTDVLVVDNASHDDTVARLRADYPWARVVANDANLGFGRANNIGMKIALDEGYDAVFLLNEDAWIAPDMLSLIVAQAERDDGRTAIFSPVHLNGAGDKLDFGFANYTGQRDIASLPTGDVVDAPFVNAAFWFIPTARLREVGGFSPLFYHYGEDVDYVNRVRHRGLRIRYVPRARACHDREQRPVTYEGWLRSERVWHLSEYGNPNHNLPTAFAYGVLAAFKKCTLTPALSLKGEGDSMLVLRTDLLRIAWETLLRTPDVLRHRRQSQLQSCFLT